MKAIASLPSLQGWFLFCIPDTLHEDLGQSHMHASHDASPKCTLATGALNAAVSAGLAGACG